jgi:hypothetical protein
VPAYVLFGSFLTGLANLARPPCVLCPAPGCPPGLYFTLFSRLQTFLTMKVSFLRRSLAFGLLPVLLSLASCGGSDPAPVPDQGRVLFFHAASNISTVGLKFLVDNAEKTASLNYGQGSGYQNIGVGSRVIQVAAGAQTAVSQNITIEKDKTYSFFAAPAANSSSVTGVLVSDDATPPAATKARIRVVNLTQNVATPIRLAQMTAVAGAGVIVNDVAGNTASAFTDFIPGSYSLFISDNANNSLAQVGDGTGNGTGAKNYEVGKLYTVVVTGTAGSLIPEQKIRVFVSQNN